LAASIPAPQCKLIMPSTGKRCGSPALRGQPFCYHHSGKHRELSRERMLAQRLDRLGEKLDTMDAAGLLDFLQQTLASLMKTFSRFPEAAFTFMYTLDRIDEIVSLESTLRAFRQQNQDFAAHPQPSSAQINSLQPNL
jgi:hypothetical protein